MPDICFEKPEDFPEGAKPQYQGSVVTINNEQEGEALLEKQVDRVLEAIRRRM